MSAISAMPVVVNPDDKLIKMVKKYLEDDHRMWEIERNKKTLGGREFSLAWKSIDRIQKRNNALLEKITATPAVTPDGIRAKAQALKAFTVDPPRDSPFTKKEGDYLDNALITSILHDLVPERE